MKPDNSQAKLQQTQEPPSYISDPIGEPEVFDEEESSWGHL
jgi:hypothetical protein